MAEGLRKTSGSESDENEDSAPPSPATKAKMDGEEQQMMADVKRWAEECELSENEVLELREGFTLFDKNDEGLIPACEMANVLRCIGQCPTEAEAEQMVNDCNQTEDGNVTMDEFMRVVAQKGLKPHHELVEDLEEAMKVFDVLGKGYIYSDELKQNLSNLGEPLSAEDIQELIKLGAPTTDGRLNYYDFVAKVTSKDV